jgi:hypothetical protein
VAKVDKIVPVGTSAGPTSTGACCGSARYHLIPTEMMLSEIHAKNEDVQFPEEVHFWSATYSIAQNAAKLDGSFFKKFLSPVQKPY